MRITETFVWKLGWPIAVGVSVVVAGVMIVSFSAQAIQTTTSSLDERRLAAAVLEQRTATITHYREVFKTIGTADVSIAAARPPVDNVGDFLAALKSIADRNSIEQVFSFSPLTNNESVSYTLKVSGTATTVLNYLKDFELLPYLTSINAIDLRAGPNGWDRSVTAYIDAILYTRPPID